MHSYHKLIFLSAALGGIANLAASPAGRPAPAPLPVSVSSANYGGTPREELRRLAADSAQVNPLTRELEPLAAPQSYVFAPGELYESDVPYDEVCRQLEGALSKKGYRNAADTQGRIARPDKIDLILRISSGGRRWREPTVRVDNLSWRQGLVDRHLSPLTVGGAQVSWEHRSGGNDDALAGAIQSQNTGTSASVGDASQVGVQFGGYDSTRDFFLLAVDAFGYQDLLEKQSRAQRRWTTFVALPREDHRSFSEVLGTMLRVATPYFGETTRGLQMFTDARATVKLGELEIIDSDVRPPAPEKK